MCMDGDKVTLFDGVRRQCTAKGQYHEPKRTPLTRLQSHPLPTPKCIFESRTPLPSIPYKNLQEYFQNMPYCYASSYTKLFRGTSKICNLISCPSHIKTKRVVTIFLHKHFRNQASFIILKE